MARAAFVSAFDLTREEEAELHEHARSKVPELLALALDDAAYEWKKTKYGPAVVEAATPSQHLVRNSVVVQAPPATVLQLLESSAALSYRNTLRTIYQQTFADASVLYHNQLHPAESIAVQWLAFRCGNPLLPDVDLCVVEYMQSLMLGASPLDNQRDGHPVAAAHCVGYKLFESIQTKHCPSLLESHRLERVVMPLSGYAVFPTSHADKTRVVFVAGLFQPPAALRRSANRRLLLLLAAALPRLQHAANVQRLGAALAQRVPWVPDAAQRSCSVCARLFTHVRRKHHCRACGQLICKQCSVFQDMALPTAGLTSIRVCTTCVAPPVTPPEPARPPKLQLDFDFGTPKKPAAVVERTYFGKHAFRLQSPTPGAVGSPTTHAASPITYLAPRGTKQLGPRPPERVQILEALCDLASNTLGCKFAGLALRHDAVLTHYLKVNQKGKLLTVPAQMGICSPVFTLQAPVLVLDTRREPPGKVDWARLPIVLGPQATRFYAGAPLVAANGAVLGAICVFDPEPRPHVPPHQLRVMQNLAELTLASLDPAKPARRDTRAEDGSLEAQLGQMLQQAHDTQRQVEHTMAQANDQHAPAIVGV
ncbi:hypothetical protein ACHHYP_14236 [Achlya hypogyna]|uniref:FYVE-type domain-containing protein n=1 Tax=Achlya hypogyna TaxID=1202772 RepID=A0A1V9YDL7_ACHHY|nr:hypothetical protein ACHHYP_14236 [Achlya hypogyna]